MYTSLPSKFRANFQTACGGPKCRLDQCATPLPKAMGSALARGTEELAASHNAQVLYVGFTPPAGVASHLVSVIDQAQTELLVQA